MYMLLKLIHVKCYWWLSCWRYLWRGLHLYAYVLLAYRLCAICYWITYYASWWVCVRTLAHKELRNLFSLNQKKYQDKVVEKWKKEGSRRTRTSKCKCQRGLEKRVEFKELYLHIHSPYWRSNRWMSRYMSHEQALKISDFSDIVCPLIRYIFVADCRKFSLFGTCILRMQGPHSAKHVQNSAFSWPKKFKIEHPSKGFGCRLRPQPKNYLLPYIQPYLFYKTNKISFPTTQPRYKPSYLTVNWVESILQDSRKRKESTRRLRMLHGKGIVRTWWWVTFAKRQRYGLWLTLLYAMNLIWFLHCLVWILLSSMIC